jgi:hypothetical protein
MSKLQVCALSVGTKRTCLTLKYCGVRAGRMLAMLAATGVALSLACSPGVDSRVARDAVDQFHAALNLRDSGAVYDALTDEAREITSRQQVAVALDTISEALGEHQSSRTLRELRRRSNTGRYVALTIESSFSKGVAQEHVVWRIAGERAELTSYSVRSTRLASVIRLGIQRE